MVVLDENIAIPVFMNRVSPLLDVAGEFKLFCIKNGEIKKTYFLDTSDYKGPSIIKQLCKKV